MHENLNLAKGNNASLVFTLFPEMTLTTTNFNVPSMKLIFPSIDVPRRVLHAQPTAIEFENLVFQFKINDGLDNYEVIANWFLDIEKSLKESQSDASILVYNTNKVPVKRINFFDVMPVHLTGFSFSYDEQGNQFLSAALTLNFSGMEFAPKL